MKKILFLLLLISTSAFAQVEHGLLVGAGVGFPLQDSWKRTTWGDESNWSYRHDYKLTSNPQLSSSASFLRLNVLSSLN